MKRILASILLITILLACKTTPKLSYETALKNISKYYAIGEPTIDTNGGIAYEFDAIVKNGGNNIYDNPSVAHERIKGAIDQGLGILPQMQVLGKVSHVLKSVYDRYGWETINEKVVYEGHLLKDDSLNVLKNDIRMHIKAKIWIVKKY